VNQEQNSKENIEGDMSLIFPKLQEMCHKIGRGKGEKIKLKRNGKVVIDENILYKTISKLNNEN
jgi:hypothetical protein